MNDFIYVKNDEMEDKITYSLSDNSSMLKEINGGAFGIGQATQGEMWQTISEQRGSKYMKTIHGMAPRRVKTDKIDSLVIDGRYYGNDWMWLRHGELTINIDSKNTKIKFNETSTDVANGGKCTEDGYWKISKELLKSICDAKKIKIRVSGKSVYVDGNEQECSEFQVICQRFYNGAYNDKKYVESLNPTDIEIERERLAEEAKKSDKKGGCFVATATMGNYNHPTVLELRQFRDQYLSKRLWGKAFIKIYYKIGPYPAALIKKSYILRKISLHFIIDPLRKLSSKLY